MHSCLGGRGRRFGPTRLPRVAAPANEWLNGGMDLQELCQGDQRVAVRGILAAGTLPQEQHFGVSWQRPKVCIDDLFQGVGVFAEPVHGGDHVVAIGLGLFGGAG